MVLEAVEDELRGFGPRKRVLAEGRCPRGALSIEHVMPQRWQVRLWPLRRGVSEEDRQALIHTLGNLTLVTVPLNSTMKRAQWTGPKGKREALRANSILRLNSELVETAPRSWTEESVLERTDRLIASVLRVWPAPTGHKVHVEEKRVATMRDVTFGEFLEAGIVAAGDTLYPIRKQWAGCYGTVLADGRIQVGGEEYDTPKDAEKAITGRSRASGWRFFALDAECTKTLRTVWFDAQEEELGESTEDQDELEEVGDL